MYAAQSDNVSCVELLLEEVGEVNKEKKTALMLAAQNAKYCWDSVQILLEYELTY